MKIIQIAKNSYFWFQALQLAAKEKYEDASNVLNKITKRDYKHWSLETFIQFALNNDKEAIYASKEALNLIDKSTIPEVDKIYMRAYLLRITNWIHKQETTQNKINKNGVSKYLLRNFRIK
jgi:hypothetical protein